MLSRKLNSQVIKSQLQLEQERKQLNARINQNQDKQILNQALDQMWVEKQKEDAKREGHVKLAQETIQENKKQQKLQKQLLKLEREEEQRLEAWNKEREKKQEAFKQKVENKRKEAQLIRNKMIDKQVE